MDCLFTNMRRFPRRFGRDKLPAENAMTMRKAERAI